MIVFDGLNRKMAERHMKTKDLAAKTLIKERTLNNKLAMRNEFTLSEMRAIQNVLGGSLDELFKKVDLQTLFESI